MATGGLSPTSEGYFQRILRYYICGGTLDPKVTINEKHVGKFRKHTLSHHTHGETGRGLYHVLCKTEHVPVPPRAVRRT